MFHYENVSGGHFSPTVSSFIEIGGGGVNFQHCSTYAVLVPVKAAELASSGAFAWRHSSETL